MIRGRTLMRVIQEQRQGDGKQRQRSGAPETQLREPEGAMRA